MPLSSTRWLLLLSLLALSLPAHAGDHGANGGGGGGTIVTPPSAPSIPNLPAAPAVSPVVTNVTTTTTTQVPTYTAPVAPATNNNAFANALAAFSNVGAQTLANQNLAATMQTTAIQGNLVLFSTANQVFNGAGGMTMAGAPGTIMKRTDRCIVLHAGRVAVAAGNGPTVIQTRMGDVKVRSRGAVIVDDQPNRPVRVMALSGGNDAIMVVGALTNGAELSLKPGEEVLMAESNIEAEDLIPADGIARVVIDGGIEKRSKIVRAKFSMQEFEGKHKIRAGKNIRMSALSHTISQGMAAKAAPAPEWHVSTLQSKNTSEKNDQPGSVEQPLVVQPGSKLTQISEKNVHLEAGSLFLPAARNNLSIDTPLGRIDVKKNSLVMIETSAHSCRIKALSGPGDIHVVAGNRSVDLVPGDEMLISDHRPAAHEINPQDMIARRPAKLTSFQKDGSQVSVSISDFSMASVLRSGDYVRILRKSDSDGKMFNRIIKTAAVVELVTRGHGSYNYGEASGQLAEAKPVEVISKAN